MVRVEVDTIGLAELRAGFPALCWGRPALPDDGSQGAGLAAAALDEAPDAAGQARCPPAVITSLQAGLPAEPGVYAWSVEAPGGRGDDEHRAVLYLGLAAGRQGLAGRLGDEIGWIRNAVERSPRWRQRWYAGHPRAILRADARLHFAVTPADGPRTAAQVARDTERVLLAFARFATGSVPMVSGSGWWSSGERHDRARESAWAAIRASTTRLAPGGPGDADGGPELADPAGTEPAGTDPTDIDPTDIVRGRR